MVKIELRQNGPHSDRFYFNISDSGNSKTIMFEVKF